MEKMDLSHVRPLHFFKPLIVRTILSVSFGDKKETRRTNTFNFTLFSRSCAHCAMSGLNSPRGQGCVVNIDDLAVASSVIKALRSSSNSNRHYKQNAARDDHLVNDVNQFNRIINDRRDEVLKSNLIEQQMNEALNSYIPPTRPMVIVQSPDERQVK